MTASGTLSWQGTEATAGLSRTPARAMPLALHFPVCGKSSSPFLRRRRVGTSAWKRPMSRHCPAGREREGRGDAGRGCGRAGAQPWKRAEHPPLPRQRRAIPHPAAPAVAWPGPPGSAGEQLTPERRLLSPHPPRLPL